MTEKPHSTLFVTVENGGKKAYVGMDIRDGRAFSLAVRRDPGAFDGRGVEVDDFVRNLKGVKGVASGIGGVRAYTSLHGVFEVSAAPATPEELKAPLAQATADELDRMWDDIAAPKSGAKPAA